MSMDNGIYILRLKSETEGFDYFVIHSHAIENAFNSFQDLYRSFHDSIIFPDEKKAFVFAQMLQDKYQTEHGVLMITDFEEITWTDLETEMEGDVQALH